jgi:hypothetical protein
MYNGMKRCRFCGMWVEYWPNKKSETGFWSVCGLPRSGKWPKDPSAYCPSFRSGGLLPESALDVAGDCGAAHEGHSSHEIFRRALVTSGLIRSALVAEAQRHMMTVEEVMGTSVGRTKEAESGLMTLLVHATSAGATEADKVAFDDAMPEVETCRYILLGNEHRPYMVSTKGPQRDGDCQYKFKDSYYCCRKAKTPMGYCLTHDPAERQGRAENRTPSLCRAVRQDGTPCKALRLPGSEFCFSHQKWETRRAKTVMAE